MKNGSKRQNQRFYTVISIIMLEWGTVFMLMRFPLCTKNCHLFRRHNYGKNVHLSTALYECNSLFRILLVLILRVCHHHKNKPLQKRLENFHPNVYTNTRYHIHNHRNRRIPTSPDADVHTSKHSSSFQTRYLGNTLPRLKNYFHQQGIPYTSSCRRPDRKSFLRFD